ncbi:MAG: hypothetical protein E6767_20295 [Dysgonomonas sp.]|nr:hypothetical protein [Dysgonomonas sp.]
MGIEIENKRGILDIDSDTTLEVELTNPLFSEEGSLSLPFKIKQSPHNNLILAFPDSYERKEQFEDKQAINIRAGIINESGTLELFNTTDEIEGVIYLHESSFYNLSQDIKLTQVFDGIERWFSPESTPRETRINVILNMLEAKIFGNLDYSGDFTIFPVAIDCELSSKTLETMVGGTAPSQDIINEVYVHYEPNKAPEYRLKAKYPYTYQDSEGNTITIPVGYGVSPFLRFGYVLRKIFEYFGLTLLTNIFDNQYRAMVVVNNTMDAIMPGYLIESQLVPDCTISEFLDIVREGFCADFKINTANKTAEIILFNDVMSQEPDVDLTPYLMNPREKVEISKPKQVKLTINKGQPYASTDTETFDEFRKKYPEYTDLQPIIATEGIFPFYMQNSIWKLSEPEAGWMWNAYKADRINSMNFDYYTTDEIEKEEHKIPFEALSAISVRSGADSFSYIMPIIGTQRNLNSHVILDGKKQSEENTGCPIMILVETKYAGNLIGAISDAHVPNYIPPEGRSYVSLHLWGEYGLFRKWWKKYDQLLRTSFCPVTFKTKLPSHVLANFTFGRLKIVNSQLFFPVSLKYTMSDEPYIETEMLFKTVKIYGDDESGLVEIPQEELNYFIGTWKNATESELQINFIFNSDYTGSISLKHPNKELNTTFSGATIYEVVTPVIRFKQLALKTPDGNLLLNITEQKIDLPKSFILTWLDETLFAKVIST